MSSFIAQLNSSQHTQVLPAGARVVRVMPNTPTAVQAGAAMVSGGSCVRPGDTDVVVKLMNSSGLCVEGAESLIDAVSAVSGSGPAYVSGHFVLFVGQLIHYAKEGIIANILILVAFCSSLKIPRIFPESGHVYTILCCVSNSKSLEFYV